MESQGPGEVGADEGVFHELISLVDLVTFVLTCWKGLTPIT